MEGLVEILIHLVVSGILGLEESPEMGVESADTIFTLLVAFHWIDIEVLLAVERQVNDVGSVADNIRSLTSPHIVALESELELLLAESILDILSFDVHAIVVTFPLIISEQEAELDICEILQVFRLEGQIAMHLTEVSSLVVQLHFKPVTI